MRLCRASVLSAPPVISLFTVAEIEIDTSNGFYRSYVQNPEHRSWMNVTFNLPTPELEEEFVKSAKAQGMLGLKGYRTLGGIRASIYNSTSPESVETLVNFMESFRKAH